MKKIYSLKQSSQTLLGDSYGYSFFWAKGNLEFPKNEENNRKKIEIPLTDDIEWAQWTQFIPSTSSELIANIYMDCQKDKIAEDILKMLIHNNDAVILGYFGLIGGHALAIKKVGDKYHYFDCNDGIYEFTAEELPKIINKITNGIYGKLFYGLVMEKVSADAEFHPSIIKNSFAAAYFLFAKIITSPAGIVRLALTLFDIIENQCNKLIKEVSDFISVNHNNENKETVSP